MIAMICSASAALREWVSTHDMAPFDRHELHLPASQTENNKAGLDLVRGRYLACFTVWGRGTTEWIIMDGDAGKEIVVEDASFQSVAELHSYLDAAIKTLASLPK